MQWPISTRGLQRASAAAAADAGRVEAVVGQFHFVFPADRRSGLGTNRL
jgi:hypothetical protein